MTESKPAYSPIVREERKPGVTLAIMRVSEVEHFHKWPCNICGDIPEKGDMFELMIPVTFSLSKEVHHIDHTICTPCKEALARLFTSEKL